MEAESSSVDKDAGNKSGSVLRPLLCTAHISPIAGIAHLHNIDQQQYTDDTQLFISVSPSDHSISIGSAVTAQLAVVTTDREIDRQTVTTL